MLLLWARVNLEQWQWRGTLHSLKLQYYYSLTIRLFSHIQDTHLEIQSVYSAAPANWAKENHRRQHFSRPPHTNLIIIALLLMGHRIYQPYPEVPAVLELWGMRSTPLLPLLPSPLWPGVVASDRAPIYGLNRTNSMLMLNWIVWIN